MNKEAGGFVDGHVMIVLVEDFKHVNPFLGTNGLGNGWREILDCRELYLSFLGIGMLSVQDADVSDGAYQMAGGLRTDFVREFLFPVLQIIELDLDQLVGIEGLNHRVNQRIGNTPFAHQNKWFESVSLGFEIFPL